MKAKKRTDKRRTAWTDVFWSVLLSVVLATSLVPAAAFPALASGVSDASMEQGGASSGSAASAEGSASSSGTSGDSDASGGWQDGDAQGSSSSGSLSLNAGSDASSSGNSGFTPSLSLGSAGSSAEGDSLEGGESSDGASTLSVSFKATLDGEEVSDAVTFADPATGGILESLSAEPGKPFSVGVAVNNPALYEVESVCLEPAATLGQDFAASLDFGGRLVLQENGSWLCAEGLSSDAVVNVRLSELSCSASVSVTGDGEVTLANRGEVSESVHALAGDRVTVLPVAASGSYLAQVRWAELPSSGEGEGDDGSAVGGSEGQDADAAAAVGVEDEDSHEEAAGADDAEEPLAFNVIQADSSGSYSFVMPEGEVLVCADFVSVVWDGAIDVTWYDPSASSFSISYAAQFAGLAAIVNGFFTTYPTASTTIEGSVNVAEIPDYDAFKKGMGVVEEASASEDQVGDRDGSESGSEGGSQAGSVSSEYYGEFSAVYKVAASQGASSQGSYGRSAEVNRTTRVIGNPDYIQLNWDEGELAEDSQNLRTSDVYYYGADDFRGKRVFISADLDFGATRSSDGTWSTSSPLYMPLGGQFAMLPGYDSTNAYSVLGSSWNGVLDGCGHSFKNVFCEYYASGGNYGDSVSIGLVGRMGGHDDEDESKLAVDPTVRQVVFESGYVSGRRSVGAIVGKIGHTSASKLNDGSTGGIVEYCVNYADVRSTDKKGTGGIVGAALNSGVIRYCANFGSVTSLLSGGTNAGGIAGLSEMLILNCYNVGEVSAKADSFSCAIATNNGGASVVNCYWLAGSAKGEACYNSNEKTDSIYEFGEGTDISQLTADLLNANSSKVWVDVEDGEYPALYYQVLGYNPSTAYGVTVVQPEVGGVLSASPLSGGFADTVNLSCEPEAGYVLDYYTLNGERLSTSSFGLDGDVEVSAVFREKKTAVANVEVDSQALPLSLTVKKDGVAPNAETGELEYVEDCVVEDGDTVYEGDVLSYGIELEEGAQPDNEALEYTGTFTVMNASGDEHVVYTRMVYPSAGATYEVSGNEGVLQIYVAEARTAARSWSRMADTSWYDPENPQEAYAISTAAQLAGLAKLVNEGESSFEETTFTLSNDISLKDASENGFLRAWQPIGKSGRSFKGVFDGGGHVVSDMAITDSTADNAALFGSIANATICNLTVGESSVQGSSYVAGIAGCAKASRVEGCASYADVDGACRYVGGVVGAADGGTEVVSCVNGGVVSGFGSGTVECVGGIAGAVQGESLVRSCLNEGEVSLGSSEKGVKAGGIAGSVANSKITECANSAKVVGSSRTIAPMGYVGGIAGAASSGSVLSSCANTGDVEGVKLGAGGVVGQLYCPSSVENCYNRGSVSVEDSSCNAGGLAAYAGSSGENGGIISIGSCYAGAIVSGGTAGAVVGKVGAKTNMADVYYDSGLCSKAVGRDSSSGSSLEATAIDQAGGAAALADSLNGQGGGTWKADRLGLNGALPMLAWQLPYDLVFFDASGAELLRCGLPAGYTASAEAVAALAPSETPEEAGVPAGYASSFAFWSSELNGEAPLSISDASNDVEAWPSFLRELVRYSVSYNLDGGENAEANPSSYTVEDDVQLASPTRDGWRFLYWSDSEGNVVSALGKNGCLGDVSLKANWSNSANCIVAYPDNTGVMRSISVKPGTKVSIEGSDDVVVNADMVIPSPDAEPEAGYRQVGYKANVSSDGSLVRMSLASFDPISYTLTYDAAGGELPSGALGAFTVESSFSLSQPSRSAYVFLGWFDAAGKKWTAVSKGTVGDVSLSAKWARDLTCAEVAGIDAAYEYTGVAVEPDLVVVHDGAQLVRGADYEISFSDNVQVGTAGVRVVGMGEGCSGVWRGEFAITVPRVTDADSGIALSGAGLLSLKEQVGDESVSLKLDASFFSYARASELRMKFADAGYVYRVGFSSELVVTRTFANGTETTERVSDGFGRLTLSVPIDAADGEAVAVYWMRGDNAELVDYASIENGMASFPVDTLGDFVLVSRQTLSGAVDDEIAGNEKEEKKGVGMVSESDGSSGGSGAAKKAEASEEKISGAGTVDDLASKTSATSGGSTSASAVAASCDGCPWCGLFGLEGLCDDLCTSDAPCPWCSAAPAVAVLLLAGTAVFLWALVMRFRRRPSDGFGY